MPATTRKKRMIIADSDEDLSNSLSLFFSNNFDVIPVHGYEEVLEHIHDAQVLLIEANLFERDKVNLVCTVKRDAPYLSVIVMCTATTRDESREQCIRQYADLIIYKPFDASRVSRIISQLFTNNVTSHPSA